MIRLRSLALPLLVPLLLAACGDDGGAAPQDPVTVTETVTASPSASETASETPSATTSPTGTASTTPSGTATPAPTEPAVDLSQPPRTYDEARAHFAAASGQQELSRFESPDGNFYCVLDDEYIPPSCEILDGAVRDPASCGESPSQKVGRIELTNRGWTAFCNTDTIRQPGAPTLGEGGVASWPDLSVRCLYEAIGVTCLETGDQQGFFFGKGRYQIF